jgi:aminopeptidase N
MQQGFSLWQRLTFAGLLAHVVAMKRDTSSIATLIFALSAVIPSRAGVALLERSDVLAPYMAHGVSHELAVWRARTVSDVRYDLTLDVTPLDSASGHLLVRFKRTGRRLKRVASNGSVLGPAAFNGNHLRIPAAALRAGENTVEIDFVSEIAPSGASIIRSHDPDGSDYLYTLLVPADANQLFPCFDQPDLKARVTFALTVPRTWTALANGSVARADTTGVTITNHFAETRPLSTYLIAFAAGPWRLATSSAGGRTINLYFRKSRAREVDADTLLALTHRAITWMEQYFGRPYPFEKFDLMLSPAFPFGGMEHPGVVMFNEDRFIFRERPTLPRRLGRFSTILHEVAHQWFGDLVTMRWFDDLWLKEGFATYMAAKALNELEPTSDAWKVFYLGNKPTAYGVDQTTGTTPLWQELANLDQAKSAYGAIVYNKAPSVLKQLNYLVGDDAFRAGVQLFLTDHAYANATWEDLLGAVGRAAGKSLDEFGRNFMLRPGMPEVEPRLTVRDGFVTSLQLTQRPAQSGVSGESPWPMRTEVVLRYRNQAPVKVPVVMTSRVTDVPEARGKPAPLFVYPNADDYGYFLSLLDSASVRALENGAFGTVDDSFLRAMLWGALWDQVRDARMDPAHFARLVLAELPRERDEQILPALLGRLERDMRAYLSPAAREQIRPEAERILWEGAQNPGRPYGPRKGYLDAFVAVAATPSGIARLEGLLAADSAVGEPVRDPTRWEVVNRLLVLNVPNAESALAAQSARDTTPDGRRRTFVAGAARPSAAIKADYFKRYFADKTLNEDWASGSLSAFNAVEHQELSLPYLRPALDSLPFIQANRRIFFLGGWLGAFLNGQTSDAALAEVRMYLADHPRLPADLRQKVLQNADELDRTVRIRKRWS